MSRAVFLYIALAAAGCAAPASKPAIVVVTPSATPGPGVSPSMADDEIVALVNGRPVTKRDVADRALALDGKTLIDQYIRWKIRQDRIAELGVTTTEDELKRRAQAIVDVYRRSQGEEALKKQLDEAKMTEAQYVERFRKTPDFADRLTTEKAFFYDLLTEGSVEFDSLAFQVEGDANLFLNAVKSGISFDDCAAATTQNRQNVARWPRYRIGHGLAIESIAKSPWIEKTLFGLKPGEVSGAEQTASGFFLVLRCVANDAPSTAKYADLRERIAGEALKGQITDDQLRAWLDKRVSACKIEYKDSYLPREKP